MKEDGMIGMLRFDLMLKVLIYKLNYRYLVIHMKKL
jgi:hypothetical protein